MLSQKARSMSDASRDQSSQSFDEPPPIPTRDEVPELPNVESRRLFPKESLILSAWQLLAVAGAFGAFIGFEVGSTLTGILWSIAGLVGLWKSFRPTWSGFRNWCSDLRSGAGSIGSAIASKPLSREQHESKPLPVWLIVLIVFTSMKLSERNRSDKVTPPRSVTREQYDAMQRRAVNARRDLPRDPRSRENRDPAASRSD
jgi:hypothetical protein